jgi:hypothetical protein
MSNSYQNNNQELIIPKINNPNKTLLIIPNYKILETSKFLKKKGRHVKFSQKFRIKTKDNPDNIFRKIKVHFFKFLFKFLNLSIKSHFGFQKYKFLKLNQNIIKDISINLNKKLFSCTLYELNCYNISNRYSNKQIFANKILMDKLFKINPNFKNLFEKKLTTLYEYYINEDCENIVKKLIGLNEGIISFRRFIENENQKSEESNNLFVDNNEYIENIKKIGYNLFNYMNNIKERKLRKKKLIKKYID